MAIRRLLSAALISLALVSATGSVSQADAPVSIRILTCDGGVTFTGQQVRLGSPPSSWRNVEQGVYPSAFVYFAIHIYTPDDDLVAVFEHSQGVENQHELVDCQFIIPDEQSPFFGHTVVYSGFLLA